MTTQAYNFPNIVKVEYKPQGASAWHKADPTNKAVNQHALLGDRVLVTYKAHGVDNNKATINPPARKASVTKYDHKVGSFAWNNLSVNDIRTHTPGKSSRKLTVHMQAISGHNLAQKLADLSKSDHKSAVVNGSVILDSAALKKFEAYVSGESAPKVDHTPHNKEGNAIKVYDLSDVQIVYLDTEKVDEKGKNRAGYARFMTALERVWFKEEPFIAKFGKAPYWHRELQMYILPVADFAQNFTQADLQAALNETATLDNAPIAESKPVAQAATASPAPAITQEQIAAIVAQAVAAALSAIK